MAKVERAYFCHCCGGYLTHGSESPLELICPECGGDTIMKTKFRCGHEVPVFNCVRFGERMRWCPICGKVLFPC